MPHMIRLRRGFGFGVYSSSCSFSKCWVNRMWYKHGYIFLGQQKQEGDEDAYDDDDGDNGDHDEDDGHDNGAGVGPLVPAGDGSGRAGACEAETIVIEDDVVKAEATPAEDAPEVLSSASAVTSPILPRTPYAWSQMLDIMFCVLRTNM